ncbi:MAG: hypothetical protein ABMB14_40355, partial [Myxococcota bacterium]
GHRPGVGGVAVFLNGTVGGMMTSLHAAVEAPTGAIPPERSFDKADTLGQLLGGMALDAIAGAPRVTAPAITARRAELFVPVVNNGFQAMFLMGTLDHRTVYHFDPALPVDAGNRPDVATEVGLVEIGPLRLLCLPGEPFPELAIGGYDGAFTPPNQSLVDPANPNPPDLAAAPPGPYLLDRLGGGDAWVIGLANDQIGYVMPPYTFEVGSVPYLLEADGDHYEETNSLGPDTAPLLLDAVDRLLDWSPPASPEG